MKLRIMTFNVRYAEPSDGLDIWELRRPIVARMIEKYRPAVIGMQEPEIEQLRDMEADLPEYARIGRSRYGNDFEKFSAVFYNKELVQLESQEMFWFSEHPDEPGTMDWKIHKPYAATIGHFLAGDLRFSVYNCQYPYTQEQALARVKASELLVQRAGNREELTFLTGDFNSGVDDEPYRILTGTFTDAFHQVKEPAGPEGTFHGFTGEPKGTYRIDWIFYRGAAKPVAYETVTYNENGRYPTDHFPVVADFEVN